MSTAQVVSLARYQSETASLSGVPGIRRSNIFPWKDKFEELKIQLKRAKQFIFLEYFYYSRKD